MMTADRLLRIVAFSLLVSSLPAAAAFSTISAGVVVVGSTRTNNKNHIPRSPLYSTTSPSPQTNAEVNNHKELEVVVQASSPSGTSTSQQSEYGKSIELPSTYVRCGRCQTSFALCPDDLGRGKGRRVECSVCAHSWFQSRDRLFDLKPGFQLCPLPPSDLSRITSNIEHRRPPDFCGNLKLYVGNLDFRVSEEDLYALFATVGPIGQISIVRDDATGRSRGFAFVTMMLESSDVEKCIALDGKELLGRPINVRPPNN